jgi:uncharacterized lipoprotein YmbA
MAHSSYFFSFLTRFLLRRILTSLKHLSIGKMKRTKLLMPTLLAVLLLASLMAVSAFASTVPTFTLSASSNQLQYVLPAGTTFNGTIATTGSVQFWVSAPNYLEIVNLGIIDKTTSFSFVAPQNGTYTLNFENDMSNSIQVTFSYVTNPVIPGSNNSTGISQSYLLITVIIAVLGSLLIIFVLHRKSKTPPSGVS